MIADSTHCCHGCRQRSVLPWIQTPLALVIDVVPNSSYLVTRPPVAMAADSTPCCHGCRPHTLLPWLQNLPRVGIVVDLNLSCYGCRQPPLLPLVQPRLLLPWLQASPLVAMAVDSAPCCHGNTQLNGNPVSFEMTLQTVWHSAPKVHDSEQSSDFSSLTTSSQSKISSTDSEKQEVNFSVLPAGEAKLASNNLIVNFHIVMINNE